MRIQDSFETEAPNHVVASGPENSKAAHSTHGMTKTRTYHSWKSMKARCLNPKSPDYKDYGARGVEICDRWVESFENFLTDMGRRPNGMSLDRINTNGNYEPGNCKWSTPKQQANNRRKMKPRKKTATITVRKENGKTEIIEEAV